MEESRVQPWSRAGALEDRGGWKQRDGVGLSSFIICQRSLGNERVDKAAVSGLVRYKFDIVQMK